MRFDYQWMGEFFSEEFFVARSGGADRDEKAYLFSLVVPYR